MNVILKPHKSSLILDFIWRSYDIVSGPILVKID